jgi:hypothetical protein
MGAADRRAGGKHMPRTTTAVRWVAALMLPFVSACPDKVPVTDDGGVPDAETADEGVLEDGVGEDAWPEDGVPEEGAGDAEAGDEPDVEAPGEGDGDGDAEAPFCATQPDLTPCDDGDLCTTGDHCQAGACVGTERDCTDPDICTDDSCNPATGECVHTPNTAPCDDGDPCTVGEACAGGACARGGPKDCSEYDDPCNVGVCNPLTGVCYADPFDDGTPCDEGDLCTEGETCLLGECGGGSAVNCSDWDDACNVGACNPATGACGLQPRPDGTECIDGADCTTPDRCQAGICLGDLPDVDSDGFYAEGCLDGDDCDDERWDVNPGIDEGPVGRTVCFDHLDNDCDTSTDTDVQCRDGLDFGVLDSPTTLSVNEGLETALIRGRAFEEGGTEADGAMTGLVANLGWGPLGSDPTDNAEWHWLTADYWGQGGPSDEHDVFTGSFMAPAPGAYSYTYRYSTDGEATWLYVDSDGNGAEPPSNGVQVDRLGSLYVVVNDHLVVTEVVLMPTTAEFIEIYNPAGEAVDLSEYYVTDTGDPPPGMTWRYWDLPSTTGSGSTRNYDFLARFPAGATLEPGERIVISLPSAQTFDGVYHVLPDYEMCPGSPDEATVPNMAAVWAGSTGCYSGGMFTNSVETLVLFRWDGASDLVEDVDIVQWGGTTEAVVKTGVSRDGPDSGTETSTYLADTAVASQYYIVGTPHTTGGSIERIELSEPTETHAGGNGLTGHDETSENWGTTWRKATAASPGT